MIVSTKQLLQTNDIRDAIVVDDAYDNVPTSADLATDRDEWNNFVDDLTEKDEQTLRSVFPAFAPGREAQLFLEDDFIESLWHARGRFRPELIDPLFATYRRDSAQDRGYVHAVEKQLRKLDLRVRTAGREFVEEASLVDLIVIDLYLGAQQTKADMHISLKGLSCVVRQRAETPPVIILMSRSGRLMVEADDFRKGSGMFASGFRTIAKADVRKDGRLEQIVRELARHRADSLKLSRFLLRWTQAVHGAVRRTEDDIRRLDLEDWAQIQDLLLSREGSGAGRYILEILQSTFLHELESEVSFLDAAAALGTLDREPYPPTTIAGSKDTLALVAKTLYEHENCRMLDSVAASPVAFGDIVGPIRGSDFPEDSVFAQLGRAVLVVMTPACDLQRGKVERILFMVGKIKSVDMPATGDALEGFRTPVLLLSDGERVWVEWERDHVITLTSKEVGAHISDDGCSITKIARLRTVNAVSLQQQLLSNIGRVGLPAPIPSTFPVRVTVYYPATDGVLTRLSVGEKNSIGGVCYVGRRSNEKKAAAPLDSEHRSDFLDALDGLTNDRIHGSSVKRVSNVRRADVLDLLFSRGLRFDPTKTTTQQWKETLDGQQLDLGRVVYGQPISQALSNPQHVRHAGLVFEVFTALPAKSAETVTPH